MGTAGATQPSTFEIIKFIVEVVLLGGVGGIGGFLWKVITDLRKESREQRELILQERKQLFEEQKQREANTQKQMDRLLAELKPAMESQATFAFEVATKYYLPVLNAIGLVEIYADTYETMVQVIEVAPKFIETRELPQNLLPIVRDSLNTSRDIPELLKSMQEALPSCAKFLLEQLKTLHSALADLIQSGYVWELEEYIGPEKVKNFLNWYYAADIPTLTWNCSPDELRRFLRNWKSGELEPLLLMKRTVPWHVFLSHYYLKLRKAIKAEG